MQVEAAFPPDIDKNNVHFSVLQYQSYMDSIIEGLKYVYRCSRLFALKKESQIFAMDDYFIHNYVTSGLLIISNINSCGISEDGIHLYFTCKKLFSLGNRPKFGILNGLPCANCQSYLLTLADLSMPKKVAIARALPIIFIFNLRPARTFNPAVYSGIKRHAIFLLQNPSPLLTFLLSPTLALHNIICIV